MFQGRERQMWLAALLAVGVWGCGGDEVEALDSAQADPMFARAGAIPGKAPVVGTPVNVDGMRAALNQEAIDSLPVIDRAFARGEMCTFTSDDYSDSGSIDGEAAFVRDMYFETVFPEGLLVGWAPRLRFTSAERVGKALPGMQAPGSLHQNQTDPEREELNRLGGELAALVMNIRFGEEGLMGKAQFGDAIVVGGPFDGFAVRDVADVGHGVLSRHLELIAPLGIDVVDVAEEIARLNHGATGCEPATYLERPR